MRGQQDDLWEQCNIVWYADDNNLSHVDTNVVTDILEYIKKHYGDLVITKGDTHDFLGMTIKTRNDKNVELIKKHQIEDTVSQFNYIPDSKATLPRAQHLWDVNNEAEILDYVKADFVHSLTAS